MVSVFGFFSVLFCAFTYANTEAMIQRTANPAIPPAMKTGSQFVCSSGSRKISLRLELNTHFEIYAVHNWTMLCNDAYSRLPFVLTGKESCSDSETDTKPFNYVAVCCLTFIYIHLLYSFLPLPENLHLASLVAFPFNKIWPSGQLGNE